MQQNIHDDLKDFANNLTESPPHEMTLCPITGKVLGQAEGELTPLPSPDDLADSEVKFKATLSDDAGLQQLLAAQEDGQPLLVTGEDGTIYQVAGKNEQGQTILIAQGGDGDQQCVYVASDENEDGNMITLDNAVTDAMQNLGTDEVSFRNEKKNANRVK